MICDNDPVCVDETSQDLQQRPIGEDNSVGGIRDVTLSQSKAEKIITHTSRAFHSSRSISHSALNDKHSISNHHEEAIRTPHTDKMFHRDNHHHFLLDESQRPHLVDQRGQNTILATVCISIALTTVSCLVIWHQRQQRKRKEWRRSSEDVLNKLRQQNLPSAYEEERFEAQTEFDEMDATRSAKKNDEYFHDKSTGLSLEKHDKIQCIGKIEASMEQKVDQSTNHTQDEKTKPPKITKPVTKSQIPFPAIAHIAKIRAQQQKQYEIDIKSTQQKRRQEAKERQRSLHKSLQHNAAEDAYQRRLYSMANEQQSSLVTPRDHTRYQEQSSSNEMEEMERVELLHQQNLEYEESLLRDQERAREAVMREERKTRRRKLIEEAKDRLISEGIETFGLLDGNIGHSGDGVMTNVVRIRLLLPSGKRVQGVFDVSHVIGMVYDLALVALDEEKLLLNAEKVDDKIYRKSQDVTTTAWDNTGRLGRNEKKEIYDNIQREWLEFFPQFSLVCTMPRQDFNDLGETLEACSLNSSAMLMVVVESD